jgi:hypothetical protein
MAKAEIVKVKWKDKRVEITAEQKLPGFDNVKATTLRCDEEPSPGFLGAMKALEEHVRTILELEPSQWKGQIEINGVSWSFSESTEVEGAVISGCVRLETSNSPFSFNAPHLPYAQYSETGDQPLMPEEAQDALAKFKREAAAYFNGKRAQGDLFAGDGKMAAAGEMHA